MINFHAYGIRRKMQYYVDEIFIFFIFFPLYSKSLIKELMTCHLQQVYNI